VSDCIERSCDRVQLAWRDVDTKLVGLIPCIYTMSDLYTSLHISPKKKRFVSDDEDDMTLTPKRLRTA
jgi:hypothetical protein